MLNFFSILLLLAPAVSFAQTIYPLPKVISKLSVLHLLDPLQPSLQLALEHQLKDRWYLHHQAEYLFKSYNGLDIDRQNGFRLRSGIRHYMPSALTRNEKTFIELSASYMRSVLNLKDDFCRFDCAYVQRIEYERRQNIFILALDYGAANYFSDRFFVEIALSGGLRLGNSHFSEIPSDAQLSGISGFNPFRYNPDATWNPIHFAFRFKLGYVLK
jgi:hypothetical protein